MTVTYTRHDGVSVAALLPRLVDLYAQVYAEPPYEEGPEQVSRFADTLPADAERPGFALVTATASDAALVAVAYGWTMPAGRWWSRADQDPPPDVLASDKFAVMEWIVRADHRRTGIGTELMRRLLADRPERWATLASDPRSTARLLYARAGWKQVARTVLPWGPAMDTLLLALPPARR
jgi:GNAT superfamily N-acetyltransferase